MRTVEKQALGGIEKLVLALRGSDGVEAAHAHNLLDGVAGAVVGVRVGAQNTAEVCLEPQVVCGDALVATLVNAVALDGAGDVDLDAHVEAGEGIVAAGQGSVSAVQGGAEMGLRAGVPVQAGDDLVLLVVGRVGEGVDVGGEAGRRRGVYAADMVVDADLLGGRLDGLLDEVDQVGGAELTQRLQRLGAGLDGREQLVFVYPAGVRVSMV